MATDNCNASFLSQVFSGSAIVCNQTFQDAETESGISQIQSVVDNADTYYGDDSPAASTAATAAAQAEAHVSGDVSNVTNFVANAKIPGAGTCDDGNNGLDFSFIGGPCIDFLYIEIAGGVVLLLIVLYFVALFSSFVPRPR